MDNKYVSRLNISTQTDWAHRTQNLLSQYIQSPEDGPDAFRTASARLLDHLADPLRVDFVHSYTQLCTAADKSAATSASPELAQALSKARLYAFIAQEDAPDTDQPIVDDKALAEHVLSRLSTAFSSTLFQAPPALHMNCSDAIADHWMSDVVTPAYAEGGLADPFLTLSKIIDLPWTEFGVCDECTAHRRKEWMEEATTLWKNMDTWMSEKS
jgi:hypothetical protein